MAEFTTPRTRLHAGAVRNAVEVILSVAVGMGLVFMLAIVLAFKKCVLGCSQLREKLRRPLLPVDSALLIHDPAPDPTKPVPSVSQ